MKQPDVIIYDTTLRDGNQASNVSFSLEDKLAIAHKLDALGVHYIEGGWPNPTSPIDLAFFEQIKHENFKTSRIAAFGSTRGVNTEAESDPILQALVKSEAEVFTIFGKCWDHHVTDVIKTTLDENLRMIESSIAYLAKSQAEVIFDAEHFFDGYKRNPDYALKALEAAINGGASWLILCDTNGGCLPTEYAQIVKIAVDRFGANIGVHNHNDTGCADANSIVAIEAGANQVQGTINGIGERCGNANLCTLIPNIEVKLGRNSIGRKRLKRITETARFVDEIANMHHNAHLPFVGRAAFTHKGGAHIDGMLKSQTSFEHMDPSIVGNQRQYLLSDQSGTAMVVEKLRQIYPKITKSDPNVKTILGKVKEMESQGYHFEVAHASFELMARRVIENFKLPFEVLCYRVVEEMKKGDAIISEATVRVMAEGREVHTAALGEGPVNALDNALRKALIDFYPQLADVYLSDYKVLVIEGKKGTSARVRVSIESGDGDAAWGTVGVSENIIEASWIALIDSIHYKLLRHSIKKA